MWEKILRITFFCLEYSRYCFVPRISSLEIELHVSCWKYTYLGRFYKQTFAGVCSSKAKSHDHFNSILLWINSPWFYCWHTFLKALQIVSQNGVIHRDDKSLVRIKYFIFPAAVKCQFKAVHSYHPNFLKDWRKYPGRPSLNVVKFKLIYCYFLIHNLTWDL